MRIPIDSRARLRRTPARVAAADLALLVRLWLGGMGLVALALALLR